MLPLFMGIGLPLLLHYLITNRSLQPLLLADLLAAFGFLFILISVFLPLYISSYSIVGEKLERSLEPLLSTPTSDEEILMGKYISVFIPVILVIYLGAVIYMVLADALTYGALNYIFYPNSTFAIILLIAVPLACLYAISFSIFISSKVNSVQIANQLGILSIFPFVILYVMGEIGLVSLVSERNILIISGVLFLMSALMFLVTRATFKREEILTDWK